MDTRCLVAILLAMTVLLAGCITDEDEDKQFSISDSPAQVTDNNNDELADILMEYGEIAWSKLRIELHQGDSDAKICYPSNQDVLSDCTYDEDGDVYWNEGETVIIKEEAGVCGGPESDIGGCKLTFQIKSIDSYGEEILLQELKVTVE